MIGWLAELVGLQWAVEKSAITTLIIVLCLMPSISRASEAMEAEKPRVLRMIARIHASSKLAIGNVPYGQI